MKRITRHHDGHGLTEEIDVIASDEPGPGGAHHTYEFRINGKEVGYLQFQLGPRNEPDSVPGVLSVAVLAALIDQLTDFQENAFASKEGEWALMRMNEALFWLRARADARAARGVLGKYEK